MHQRIAIVDDEEDIVELVAVNLKNSGFSVKGFNDAGSFLRYIKNHIPHLIVLDLMLPDMDGFEVCKHIRKIPQLGTVPIIMLTAKADVTDKVLGLELGADDYITKPFSPKELVARVKAALRRATPEPPAGSLLSVGDIRIDAEKYAVTAEGKSVDLTSTEFKILQLLATKRGYVFSRDKILDYLWGEDKIVIDRTIDVHIRNLRGKLGKRGTLVKNVRGVGYKLDE